MVSDAADKAAADEARAWEIFDTARQERDKAYQSQRERIFSRAEVMHCLECGDDIPRERQLAMPHTRRCARCASDLERR